MSHKVLILNGPNLNLLGQREPEIYGSETLDDIERLCAERAESLGLDIVFTQSNHEGTLVERIQAAKGDCDGIILNAGAFTHTSVAILDALMAVDLPVIEVHLSNPNAREPYRHHSYISQVARGVICGFRDRSYTLALDAMAAILKDKKSA